MSIKNAPEKLSPKDTKLINLVQQHVQALTGKNHDFNALVDYIGDAQVVLLGESTHGTHEFYEARARITQKLIQEKGFNTVAIEGDWPDTNRANRFIQANRPSETAPQALEDFKRFPTWMWRNREILALVEWLQKHNSAQEPKKKVGFYGLDLYSLHRSIEAVIDYLDATDPAAALQARALYHCFERFGQDPQVYGYFAALNINESCKAAALHQLAALRKLAFDNINKYGLLEQDELFYAEQNARVVKNAEHYYRSLFEGSDEHSWNVRDRHMMETVEALIQHRTDYYGSAKTIIWAHNSHIGNARATSMGKRGELNIGQLARDKYGDKAVLVGFTTSQGTVSAATEWGGPVERKRVRAPLKNSWEELFQTVGTTMGVHNFLLTINDKPEIKQALSQEKLERAIGVIYRPETERQSHYFYANLAEQFDAVIHYNTTRAVEPLERTSLWDQGELPETYPTGL
jgi:erythromycin esterase-like protein